jgi:peroxiredoxin
LKKFIIFYFFFLFLFPKVGQGALKQGDLAPDFSSTCTDGKILNLYQIKEKIILIEFFSTKCFACDYVISDINRLYEKFNSKNVLIIGILFNDEVDNITKAMEYVKNKEINYPVCISDVKVKKLFSIYGFPNFFILNEKRHILKIYRGITKDTFGLLNKEIERLLINRR